MTKKEYNKAVSDEDILRVIRENPNITIPKLSEKLGYSESNTYRRTAKLQKQGLINKTLRETVLSLMEGESNG